MGAQEVKIQDVEMAEQLGGRENEGRENTRRGNADIVKSLLTGNLHNTQQELLSYDQL